MPAQSPKTTQDPNKERKPWIYYYLIVLAVIFLFNLIVVPCLLKDK